MHEQEVQHRTAYVNATRSAAGFITCTQNWCPVGLHGVLTPALYGSRLVGYIVTMACHATQNITVTWLDAGAGFLPYIPTWGKLLPGIVPATLVASVLFFTPVRAALLTG